jgi:hypothetical protein
VSPVNQSTPKALNHLIQDASLDVKQWHGDWHPEYALDGIDKLSNNDLASLGLDDKYYDAILELHEQIMSSMPRCGECMDNRRFDDTSATWVALNSLTGNGCHHSHFYYGTGNNWDNIAARRNRECSKKAARPYMNFNIWIIYF